MLRELTLNREQEKRRLTGVSRFAWLGWINRHLFRNNQAAEGTRRPPWGKKNKGVYGVIVDGRQCPSGAIAVVEKVS
jgi:hypothetical protein